MSLFVNGKCIGVKVVPQTNRTNGETWDTYEIGVNMPKPNGFEGETETVSIKISKDQQKANLHELYRKLIGQDVWIPVWVRAFPIQKGVSAGYQLCVSGDGKPLANSGK